MYKLASEANVGSARLPEPLDTGQLYCRAGGEIQVDL
jgi:hypothetical protein